MNKLKLLAVAGFAVSMAGCVPDWASENETGLIMEIAGIRGVAGGAGTGTEGAILFSDVSQWINDDAIVTVNVYRKNPTVTSTSALEHVRLESYEVRYFRTDGHSVEGLDVPHRITGPLNSIRFHTPTETGEIETDAVINIVRHTAKREAPLINLIDSDLFPNGRSLLLTGNGIITTVAEITVYARQVTTGEPLSATGSFQVAFADFVDAGNQ
jgi:hypothetical protein